MRFITVQFYFASRINYCKAAYIKKMTTFALITVSFRVTLLAEWYRNAANDFDDASNADDVSLLLA